MGAMTAAGPWYEAALLPDNARLHCIVQVVHLQRAERVLFLLKYARGRWIFADGNWLSNEWMVLRWAYVLEGA